MAMQRLKNCSNQERRKSPSFNLASWRGIPEEWKTERFPYAELRLRRHISYEGPKTARTHKEVIHALRTDGVVVQETARPLYEISDDDDDEDENAESSKEKRKKKRKKKKKKKKKRKTISWESLTDGENSDTTNTKKKKRKKSKKKKKGSKRGASDALFDDNDKPKDKKIKRKNDKKCAADGPAHKNKNQDQYDKDKLAAGLVQCPNCSSWMQALVVNRHLNRCLSKAPR
eukprot:g4708.t1